MPAPSPSAVVVRAALGDEDLDPAVRALAIERIEAQLLALAQAHGPCVAVTLSAREGTFTLDPPTDDRALVERMERALLVAVAPTVGAARLAARNGERARARASEQAPAEVAPPTWESLALALARVVSLQQRALESVTSVDDDTRRALREAVAETEAMARRLRAR